MLGTWPLLLFLQDFSSTAQAASLPSSLQIATVTHTQPTNLTIANHASNSFSILSNEVSLFFADWGDSIPAAELRHTLSVASAHVQDHLPHHSHEPISRSHFETNISFPETGDHVYLWVYAYGLGLSWLQLSRALMRLQEYMLGEGPGHPQTHCQELRFYVQIAPAREVATGVVEYTPGARTVAKRDLLSTTIPTPQNDSSALDNPTLPIVYRIGKTNLDLNITSLGDPIPEQIILSTIEAAFTDIMLNHTDIESLIPAGQPYSFNATFGKWPTVFTAEIQINSQRGKRMSWGLVCLLIYGLKDFMQETKHFNVMQFKVLDGRLGKIGRGDVVYRPAVETASTERLKLK